MTEDISEKRESRLPLRAPTEGWSGEGRGEGNREKAAPISAESNAPLRSTPFPPADDLDHEPARRSFDWSLARWLYGYTRPYAGQRNALLALVVIRSIQLPLLAWAMGRIIEGPIARHARGELVWCVAGWFGLVLLTQLVLHFRQRYALELGEAVVHDLRNDIFVHLQRMQMSFFSATKLGRIISRMTSDVEAIRAGVQDVLFCSLVGVGQMIVAGALMAWADWSLFLVVLGMAPVLWLANLHLRQKLGDAYHAVQESFSRVTSCVVESIQGIQVTQVCARQELNAQQFGEIIGQHGRNNVRAARLAGVFQPLLEFNSQFFLAVVLMWGGYRVLSGQPSTPLGDLVQFFFLAGVFFGPIQTLGDQYNQGLQAMAGIERVRGLLDTPPDWVDPPHAHAVEHFRGQVQFQRVSFGYVPGRIVLHEIDFSVRPGEMVALVGHTGCGKTSVINLLAKFYLPQSGRILLDGHDLTQLSTDCVRGQIGIVLQQNFLFSGTVLDNILVGRRGATRADALAVLRQLGCLDLFEALPDGLATEVGEAGGRLSVGQRQLVCFARAMLADPAILILDEATSSIDLFTERRIQQALAQLLRGRTSFVVAHRLSTIRHAHQVLVFEAGRIIERGTHAQLIEQNGPYAALHRRSLPSHAA